MPVSLPYLIVYEIFRFLQIYHETPHFLDAVHFGFSNLYVEIACLGSD